MIKTSIEKLAEDIGFDIGNSDSETQAKLLKGFARALSKIGTNTNSNFETQLCYIEDDLDTNARQIIVALAEFCKDTLNKG